MDYPHGPKAITRIFIGKRQKGQSQRRKCEVEVGMMRLLTLKMEEVQVCRNVAVPKNRKKQGNSLH